MLNSMYSVSAGLHKRYGVKIRRVSSGTEQKKRLCNLRKKFTRHFKAIFQQSHSPKMNCLPTLIKVFSIEAGLHKMFEAKIEESGVQQSGKNDCVIFEKVD